MMKKPEMLAIAIVSGMICIILPVMNAMGIVPDWLTILALLVFFPVFVISLYLWWNISGKEGDIPFVGY